MRSLRFKIITPFLLGSLLLTVFLSYYTHSSAQKAVKDSVLLISKAQTKNVYNAMSLLFRAMSTSVEKMTTDPHVTNIFTQQNTPRNELETETKDWFEILTQGNEYYRNIQVLDAAGVCLASNSLMQVGVSYASRQYVKETLAGESILSEASVGAITHNLTATAASPVYINGEVVGAVVLVNDFPELITYPRDVQDGLQSVFTALLAPGGEFVAHRDKMLMGKDRYPELYAKLAAMKGGGAVEYTVHGEEYLGYAMVEPTTGWVIISSGLRSELFRHAENLSVVVFLVSMVALYFISFFVVRIVNGVLSALFSLITYAKKISEGDLTLKLANSNRNDELGTLHKALQAMVGTMRDMVNQSQAASKMKSEFLANTSHEIRTPLNAVIGMAHLYLADDSVSEKKRDYIVKIRVAAKTLLGIINNILDISKIEAGMFSLEQTHFNLRDILGQVIAIHQDNAAGKGLELSAEYPENLPEDFIGDPVRIEQVINNLTSNALKFTEQGYVRIRCELAAPVKEGGECMLRISVTDSGLGIPEEKLADLFKPFTQADASITRRFGGTGLGLAISDKIVQLLGGSFTVESTPNIGTTFSFTLPLELAPEGTAHSVKPDPDEGFMQLCLKGKSILIVEDNEINQMVMEELLRPTGAEVVMADNGLLAVEAVRERAFDLVLMDMQMPVMDGLQASREIRTFVGYDELPIVAVTANAMKEGKDESIEAGLNDYITKPVEPQQLLAALKRWIR